LSFLTTLFWYFLQILSVDLESKKWVEENRICDAPGSWFCRGQYPPALEAVLKEKKDFKQLEDFNAKGGDDQDYQKKYFENLQRKPGDAVPEPDKRPKLAKLKPDEIDLINEDWTNTEVTSLMYELIAGDKYGQLVTALKENPRIAHVRSEDGRGPMFWAHEHGRTDMIKVLKALGVSETRTDANGRTPLDK
jgi:dolichyl-diphosphooligosaccharide---protein glycosyltransferase